jgi:hypothetical protein
VSLLLQAEEEELDQFHDIFAMLAIFLGPYDSKSILQIEHTYADLGHFLAVERPVLGVDAVYNDVIDELVGKLLNGWIATEMARDIDALETKTVLENVEVAGLLQGITNGRERVLGERI